MNRTQRAILRSCKEAAASSRRQKNDTIQRKRELQITGRKESGEDRKLVNRNINHLSECIKRDERNKRSLRDDVILYKKRFADAKPKKEDKVV